MAVTSPRTVLMPGGTLAVQLVPGGPVEAVTCLQVWNRAIYFDCTCSCHGTDPACPHAAAVGDRLVRDGVARRTQNAAQRSEGRWTYVSTLRTADPE